MAYTMHSVPIIHTIHNTIGANSPRVKLHSWGFLFGIQTPPLLGKFNVFVNQKLYGESDEYGRFLFHDYQHDVQFERTADVGPSDYIICDTLEIEFNYQHFYHMAAFCKGRNPVGNALHSDILFDEGINFHKDENYLIMVMMMRRNSILSEAPADPAECIEWAKDRCGIECGLRYSS